jgi:hypothetical protein
MRTRSPLSLSCAALLPTVLLSGSTTAWAQLLHAPKGLPGMWRSAIPQSLETFPGVFFNYVSGYQVAEADGASVRLFQAKPYLARDDFHSLAELAVISADFLQVVEVGWGPLRARTWAVA